MLLPGLGAYDGLSAVVGCRSGRSHQTGKANSQAFEAAKVAKTDRETKAWAAISSVGRQIGVLAFMRGGLPRDWGSFR